MKRKATTRKEPAIASLAAQKTFAFLPLLNKPPRRGTSARRPHLTPGACRGLGAVSRRGFSVKRL